MENYTYYIAGETLQAYGYSEIVSLIHQGAIRPEQRVKVFDNITGESIDLSANKLL